MRGRASHGYRAVNNIICRQPVAASSGPGPRRVASPLVGRIGIFQRGGTMQLRTKLMTLAMAGGTAALVFSGVPALASSHAPSKPITGPEIASGVIHGKRATANNPIIPVAWRGLVTAHGIFSTNGGPPPKKGQRHTFTTSAGNLTVVVTAKPTNRQHFNREGLPLLVRDLRRLRRARRQEHRQVRGDLGSGRGAGPFRRVRAEVQVRPEEGPVQHQPESARAGEGRGRVLPVERGAEEAVAAASWG